MALYIDIILLENTIMNYILMLTTAIICNIKPKYFRFFLGSILGSVYAVGIYITSLKIFNNQITKLLISIGMIYISFNSKSGKQILKQLLIFYLTSFCFGGISYYFIHSLKSNYSIKIEIYVIAIGTTLAITSFRVIKTRISKKDLIYEMEIEYKNKRSKFKVLLDTGNMLADPITNIPVAVIEESKIEKIITRKSLEDIKELILINPSKAVDLDLKCRCSIISFNSIGNSSGIIIGFRPDKVRIYLDDEERIIEKCILGIYDKKISINGMYHGLIGLNLINYAGSWREYEYNSNIKI